MNNKNYPFDDSILINRGNSTGNIQDPRNPSAIHKNQFIGKENELGNLNYRNFKDENDPYSKSRNKIDS